ncbi:hypothetical protein AN958_07838 [Leucoagaricus sp. SymC.cos]|nr:hypothetical protein AN958_07838 [Leucoagaricus sp. SymC.cos]
MPKDNKKIRKQPNQHLPCPPKEVLAPDIAAGWCLNLSDVEIHRRILKTLDKTRYGLSIRQELSYNTARSKDMTYEVAYPVLVAKRGFFQNVGYEELRKIIKQENGLRIPRRLIKEFCHSEEPDLIAERLHRRLVRRVFWAAGVNDVCCFDQHDKLQRFGIRLHTGLDPYSGRIHWMRVSYTNRNPVLIASYYLNFVEDLGAMPLVTQSDPGTENVGIANAHTVLCQLHDPSLEGTLQHRTMRNKMNIPPEIIWAQFRKRLSPALERVISEGFDNGMIDSKNDLDTFIFRYIFFPWIQEELDGFVDRVNWNRKRNDRRKVHPQGPPHDIFFCPEEYGVKDFKVLVDLAFLAEVRARYAPPDHPVFQLYPPEFRKLADEFSKELDLPVPGRGNVWQVFQTLQNAFWDYFGARTNNSAVWPSMNSSAPSRPEDDHWQLIPHHRVVPDYVVPSHFVERDPVQEELDDTLYFNHEGEGIPVITAFSDEGVEEFRGAWF